VSTDSISVRLARLIAANGPIPVSTFMAEANAHYYGARDRLTAPEQMGTLFKALALVGPGWPEPEGFA
jgi:SAM-dependent MidA family methyltransferase